MHESPFSDGIENMPRRLTNRERTWDLVQLNLHLASRHACVLFALGAAKARGVEGAVVGFVAGWLVGVWMRHSMGGRDARDPLTFYRRMQQRGRGSRPRLLERFIEAGRGSAFSREKCARLWQACEDAMTAASATQSELARRRVFEELDERTKRISYE